MRDALGQEAKGTRRVGGSQYFNSQAGRRRKRTSSGMSASKCETSASLAMFGWYGAVARWRSVVQIASQQQQQHGCRMHNTGSRKLTLPVKALKPRVGLQMKQPSQRGGRSSSAEVGLL